jgi:hypothetical protein
LLERAKEHKEQAEDACRGADLPRTKKLLKRAIRQMIKISQTLRSRRARKKLPGPLREAILDATDAVQVDLRTLKREVQCPDAVAS